MIPVLYIPPSFVRLGDRVLFRSLEQEAEALPGHFSLHYASSENLRSFLSGTAVKTCRVLIGVSPAADDISRAKRIAAECAAAGVPRSCVLMLALNSGLPGGVSTEFLEREVGKLAAVFPYDPELFVACENQRLSLQDVRPKSKTSRLLANVIARLNAKEADALTDGDVFDPARFEKTVRARLWSRLQAQSPAGGDVDDAIDAELHDALLNEPHAPEDRAVVAALRQRILDFVTGMGPIEPFLRDSAISEIMVNGVDEIYVERDGRLEKCADRFDSEEQLRAVIARVVARAGRRIDAASPVCDARLEDGSRLNAVLPPLALKGPTLTIRRFKSLYQSMSDLIGAGTLSNEEGLRLAEAVAARKNIVVAGNTGSGKTTLLNILAGCIPDNERIITLEDAAELQIRQPHVVRLETRSANTEGIGEIAMNDLVINALRMRPDRLIVGECRGREVVPMLQAMNTGHDGSMTTVHANSAEDALKRLEAMVLLAVPNWPVEVVRQQIRAGLDLIVYLKREGRERKLKEIYEIV